MTRTTRITISIIMKRLKIYSYLTSIDMQFNSSIISFLLLTSKLLIFVLCSPLGQCDFSISLFQLIEKVVSVFLHVCKKFSTIVSTITSNISNDNGVHISNRIRIQPSMPTMVGTSPSHPWLSPVWNLQHEVPGNTTSPKNHKMSLHIPLFF